jgi:hypothetical protein
MLRRDFLKAVVSAFCASAAAAKVAAAARPQAAKESSAVAVADLAIAAAQKAKDDADRLLQFVNGQMRPVGMLTGVRGRKTFQIVYTTTGPAHRLADWEVAQIADSDALVRAGLAVPVWAEIYNGGDGAKITYELVGAVQA